MKKTLRSLLMTALLLSLARTSMLPRTRVLGAVPEQVGGRTPVVVVSIASYDKVMDAVGFIGRLAQRDGLEKQADAMITLFTQGKGLNGLDTKRPWGLVLNTDGSGFQPLGFLPITDLNKLLDATAGLIGPVEEKADGILQIDQLKIKSYCT